MTAAPRYHCDHHHSSAYNRRYPTFVSPEHEDKTGPREAPMTSNFEVREILNASADAEQQSAEELRSLPEIKISHDLRVGVCLVRRPLVADRQAKGLTRQGSQSV